MAHFAEIDENGIVTRVLVVKNDELLVDGVEQESKGIQFLEGLYGHSRWVQTSYNRNFRKNYAGISYRYDASRDAFIPPQPFPSWSLDESECRWRPPVEYPNDGNRYRWNEDSLGWTAVTPQEG